MVEQEEQEQYISEQYDGMVDSYNTIQLRLDPTPTLDEIRRYFLKKTRYDPSTKVYSRPSHINPMFDEEGVEELMLELRARMSIDKVLSQLTEKKINEIVRELGEVVIEFIFMNYKKYHINPADHTKILILIKHNVEIFLRRAVKGTENILLAKGLTHREVRNIQSPTTYEEQPQYNPKPGFGFFGGGKGRR